MSINSHIRSILTIGLECLIEVHLIGLLVASHKIKNKFKLDSILVIKSSVS